MVRPGATTGSRTVPGPDALAGAALTSAALQHVRVDPATLGQVVTALGDLLPGHPIQAGSPAVDRMLPANALASLIPSAAIVASGLDPAQTTIPAPAVLWTSGVNRLLIKVAGVTATPGAGTIVLTVPVWCDQTADAAVTVTFAMGTPDRPAGGIVTCEDHPRGPAIVVENWAEALVAFAWHTLLVATNALSGAAGGDFSGHNLVTASVTATEGGLSVTPMGRHAFLPGRQIP